MHTHTHTHLHHTHTQVYISQCFGTYQVGFTLIALGVSSAITSIVCSRLVKYLPRFLVVLFGVALSVAMLLFMLFWERVPSYYVIFTIAVGWGASDAVWNTMPTSRLPLNQIGLISMCLSIARAVCHMGTICGYIHMCGFCVMRMKQGVSMSEQKYNCVYV